jgi:hypothetical protein
VGTSNEATTKLLSTKKGNEDEAKVFEKVLDWFLVFPCRPTESPLTVYSESVQ